MCLVLAECVQGFLGLFDFYSHGFVFASCCFAFFVLYLVDELFATGFLTVRSNRRTGLCQTDVGRSPARPPLPLMPSLLLGTRPPRLLHC